MTQGTRRVLAGGLALVLSGAGARGAYLAAPSLLTDAPLAVARPADFRDHAGGTSAVVAAEGAVFEGRAVAVAGPAQARLRVRRAGTYALWIRAHQPPGAQATLLAELVRGSNVLVGGRLNEGKGAPGRGGPDGWRAYRDKAVRNTSRHAAVGDLKSAMLREPEPARGKAAEPLDADTTAMADALIGELQKETGQNWATLDRLEQPGATPFYWWKLGPVSLAPGDYDLRLQPADAGAASAAPALVDAAFLAESKDLDYPFAPDLAALRASYVRFRLDKVPKAGVGISCWLYTHMYAYPKATKTPVYQLNPSGMKTEAEERHTQPGYTRWYCLQDMTYAPPLAYTREVGFNVVLDGPAGVEGATQFAMYPFADSVVREIAWSEPGGKTISMAMDFETYPHLLRTYRDHARENYESAWAAAGGQVFPLTRGALYLRASAAASEAYESADYAFKAMRLLGINKMNSGYDTLAMRERYGWWCSRGQARMEWHLPFDEEKSRQLYEEAYRFYADPEARPVLENVPATYMVDEPGEGARSQMSSPLWVYVEEPGQPPRWVDYPGLSDLHTRATNFSDCVLEGAFAKMGALIEFRAATDAAIPAHFAYWRIGAHIASENGPENVMVGRDRHAGKKEYKKTCIQAFAHKAADFRTKPVRFKIVYEKDKAALFLGESLVYVHENLPCAGGFGFAGDAKEVWDLRLRPIGKGEHILAEAGALAVRAGGGKAGDGAAAEDLGEAMGLDELPGWARPKPLRERVQQDWLVSGGMPEAHAGFRTWAAARGLEPGLFGAATWDGVRPLTLSHLVQTPADARRLYWGRRYSSWLSPRMWSLAMDGIRQNFPRKDVMSVVALSGGGANIQDMFPVDMFELASYTNGLMPGISDWHTHNAENQQVNAFSAAMFNAGARRYGQAPASIAFMHVVAPSLLRTYTTFANNIKYLSFYTFGPSYADSEGWSDTFACYPPVALLNNRVCQVDDLAAPGLMRSSRVALLYAMSSEYWGHVSMEDKRASFLALSHEYYQPELVTESQVAAGALEHYDALYVLDPNVAAAAQARIAEWVRAGGLLWACADAATRNEYNEPEDLLAGLAGLTRSFGEAGTTLAGLRSLADAGDGAAAAPDAPEPEPAAASPEPESPPPARPAATNLVVAPAAGEADFRPHSVVVADMPAGVAWPGARVRARYSDGRPAWLEGAAGKGRVVYLGHRAGKTYASKVVAFPAAKKLWSDTGRALLAQPLHEARVERELVLSEPLFVATPLSTPQGTLVVLYNMQPSARTNVELSLKEPARPHSVEIFEGYRLVPLPHGYEGGRVTVRLPAFTGGQMVVVRRQAPPADDRLASLQSLTKRQLESSDWATVSAGAFFAGFRPEWDLGGKLIPLLSHPQWQVRRQAAESLGLLKHAAAGDALLTALAREPDAHARGDELLALARLGRPEARQLAADLLGRGDAFVQQQAARAARILVFGENDAPAAGARPEPGPELAAFGVEIAERAAREPDLRVRREGIRLLGLLAPAKALAGARQAFSQDRPDALGQPAWADALAANDAAFGDYLRQGLPGGDGLLLALASRRAHGDLARALEKALARMPPGSAQAYVDALVAQKDRALCRAASARRAELPKAFTDQLPYVLENVFEARLGSDLGAWDAWLAQQDEQEQPR